VDFVGFSYGFRPGRGPHQSLDALAVGIERKKVNWVLDADIREFFTNLDHHWLMKFLDGDGSSGCGISERLSSRIPREADR